MRKGPLSLMRGGGALVKLAYEVFNSSGTAPLP